MEEFKFSIGIDISKDDFHVCIKHTEGKRVIIKGTRKFENSANGFPKFLDWVLSKTKGGSAIFVMEATGVYHEELTNFLYAEKQAVSVCLANKLKYFAKSLNIKTKNDKVDAQTIAQYGVERNLNLWEPMIPQMKNLRSLCRERLSMKKDLSRYKSQIHGLKTAHETPEFTLNIKQDQICFTENSIIAIENEIKRITENDEEFNERVNKITMVKGLRMLTVVTVLAETNGFALFKNIRQVVSYSGLDIAERQSGKFRGKTRITKKGNARIRQCLYMPALTATNHNEHIKKLYERIVERNPTIKRKGIVAGMRKLLILIFVLWKNNEDYDPTHPWNSAK